MRKWLTLVVAALTPLAAVGAGLQSAPADTAPIDGYWLGTLRAGALSLRVQIAVQTVGMGKIQCTLDSLDQNASNLACANVTFAAPAFSFDVPVVNGHWQGRLADSRTMLTGSWRQGQGKALPLDFARQDGPLKPQVLPAMPPVSAADMEAVLRRDMGLLPPDTPVGITIGVVSKGLRQVFAMGVARPDSLFEIGSVTKTFTGLALAQWLSQGKIRTDTPVRELLPPRTVAQSTGTEITVLDLVTQHSGLPRLPDNFHPADVSNPYADYSPAKLYEFMARHGVQRPPDAGLLYSNLGFGLLGQALSLRAGVPYQQLLKDEVTGPLGLEDTVIALTPEQQDRFLQGHDAENRVAHAWEFDALAGAGAIRSTAADMLTYLEAQLHADRLGARMQQDAHGRTLPEALALSHELRLGQQTPMPIAFAWFYDEASGSYWHNGATGGFSSFVFFSPSRDCAGVVLMNRTLGTRANFVDLLGAYLQQRLSGLPAIPITQP